MSRPRKQKTLREIVKAKRWAEDCPRCMSEMDYIELSKIEKLWAPSEYAWECIKCPLKVRILDGHIDPKKRTAITERCREEKRAELFRMIGIIGFGQKPKPKADPEKEEPEAAAEVLEVEEPPKKVVVVPHENLPAEVGVTAAAPPG